MRTRTLGKPFPWCWERRYPQWRQDERVRRRAVAALQRLGYSYEQIRSALGGLEEE